MLHLESRLQIRVGRILEKGKTVALHSLFGVFRRFVLRTQGTVFLFRPRAVNETP